MKSHEYRNDPLYLRNRQFMVGSFDMPFVYAQDVKLEDIQLIGFDKIRSDESSSGRTKTVHFFLDDYKFDEVWKMPERELERLSQYSQLLSPDFSVYNDMPEPIKLFNTFKNRWCASFWQYNKQLVIPTISWGDEHTFNYCFDGIEEGCVVAVSTVGNKNNQEKFMHGFEQMCKVIRPPIVLNYGTQFDEMDKHAKIITLPYKHGSQRDDD